MEKARFGHIFFYKKHMLKKLFFIFSKYSGLNWLCGKLMNKRIFIVGYHSVRPKHLIDNSVKHVSMDVEIFEKQIKYLLEHGHTIISFSDLDGLKNKKIKKPTIIYFDDGFKDNLVYALPVLKKLKAKATFFVVPKYADENGNQYMNWEDIRKLVSADMEMGSHTYSHKVLTETSDKEILDELISSKGRIEKEIGKKITAFSYPKGRFNEKTAELVKKAGYSYAVTTRYGTNGLSDTINNKYTLKKVAPRVYENMKDFQIRLYSFNLFYD